MRIDRLHSATCASTSVLLLAAGILLWPLSALAADVPQEAREGTKQYKQEDYDKAAESFRQAVIAAPSDDRWRYGLGLSQAKSGDLESAAGTFESAANAKDPKVAADALYNEGNVHLAQKNYAEAVKSYRRSLLKQPQDPDAKRNLEIAMAKLLEQQQQQQQNQSSDSTGQQQQDQNQKGDQQKDKDKQQQNNPDSSQSQQQQPDSTQQAQQDSLQNAQQPDSTMTREQAERILQSLADKEAKLREQAHRVIAAPAPGGKDW